MERKIFESFKDGIDFCIENHNGKICHLQFVGKHLNKEPDADEYSKIGFVANIGVHDKVSKVIGESINNQPCRLWSVG